MKPGKSLLAALFLLSGLHFAHAQIWPKRLLQNDNIYAHSILNCYDKGYLIGGGYRSSQGIPVNGSLIKVDRNADLLWFKKLGNNERTDINDVSQTSDGGYIISGSTGITDLAGDPFVMKLDACGEREWCRVYQVAPDQYDFASHVVQVSSGYVVLVYNGNSIWGRDIISLYKLDLNGDLLWQQLYCQQDTLMIGPEGTDLDVSPDNHYIVTGMCYYPEPDSVWPKYHRPLIVKVDSTGEAEWEVPWTKVGGNQFFGKAYQSILDNKMNIYSSGDHYYYTPDAYALPVMIKTDAEGNEGNYFNLFQPNRHCEMHGIKWFLDSTIAIHGGWITVEGGEPNVGVLKVNKGGYLLDSVQIGSAYSFYYITDAAVDADNKIVLVQNNSAGGKFHPDIWKFNSDLEYDTLYFFPLAYDTLCTYPIVSDTIPLDCVIVGMDEPKKSGEPCRLSVWPNPAQEILHIAVPDRLETVNATPVFSLTTVYNQWQSATIEVLDLFGRRMFARTIRQGDQKIEANISTWPRGMYIVRLVYNGRTVADAKVLVE